MRWSIILAVLITLPLLPAAAPAAESVKTIAVTAKEFSFTPNAIVLKAGQRVAIRLTNGGTMDHEFVSPLLKSARDVEVKAEGVKVEGDEIEEVEVEPGHSVTIEFTVTKAATFTFWCAEKFKGKLHRDLGMKGTITVRR